MKESDYLNPNDIKSQCDQAIHKLENDNETLDIVSKSVTAFSTDNEIKSVSFENLKQQLADYITVIDAIKSANAYDIAEFSTLKDLVGDEVLDGANIQSQMKKALDNKEFYLEKADEYEMKKETSNSIIDLYYSWKVNDYKRLAESSQKLYDEWKSKSDKYDEIEGSTSILFSTTSSLREAITTALNSMSGRFQSGTYIPRTGFDWKKIMEVECLKLESWLKAKEELKLSESETEYLKQKGIVLTTMDIACIKRTEGTELVFLMMEMGILILGSIIIFALYIYVAKKEILWNKSMKNYTLGLGGIIGIYFAVIVYYLWQLKHWMEKFSGLDVVKEIGKEQGILNLSTKYARESTMMGMVVYVAFFIVLWIALKKNTENKEA